MPSTHADGALGLRRVTGDAVTVAESRLETRDAGRGCFDTRALRRYDPQSFAARADGVL